MNYNGWRLCFICATEVHSGLWCLGYKLVSIAIDKVFVVEDERKEGKETISHS